MRKKLTQADQNKYKPLLEEKKAELVAALRHLDDIRIETAHDAMEEVQQAADRDLAIRNHDMQTRLLRKVQVALDRIKDDDFGHCQHCEEDITPKRLAAVPWTPYCIRCQEVADRHAGREDHEEVAA